MRCTIASLLAAICLIASANALSNSVVGPRRVKLWKLRQQRAQKQSLGNNEPSGLDAASTQATGFTPQFFEQPLDHFDKNRKDTFQQRFWVSTRNYQARKGAPVIVLDSGEADGEERLPFLDTGIVEILTKATGGVGVVLEHRYYGQSIPVLNFSTDALRFLDNSQAAADSANFMRNVKFDGINEDLTAPGTPWIYYGGSYAGARSAHMKILYPDIVWGAIASSGVVHAAVENWQYMDIIRTAANATCSSNLVNSVAKIDSILLGQSNSTKQELKGLFGLAGLTHNTDFASMLELALNSWQNKNWNDAINDPTFDLFCDALNQPFGNVTAKDLLLPFGHPKRSVQISKDLTVDAVIMNYAAYIKDFVDGECDTQFQTLDECFGTYNDADFQSTDLSQTWRTWNFQVCTQWGYFTTAPPDNRPRIISRLLDLTYESKMCKQAFPPGQFVTVPPLPNVESVNILGDFHIAADRLAIIDGQIDPWRPDTAHSSDALPRRDTTLRPFKLIPNAVHHYDEYGLANIQDEPPEILKIHQEEIAFVQSWLHDWNVERGIAN
ncbi:peptidase S28 [Agrocybe pediades]|nr:peptidase S28 [Agrocybe pediades]